MTVVDFTARRVGRLEKQQRETNVRLGRVEDSLGRVEDSLGRVEDSLGSMVDSLGRVVGVLEVHSRHFERLEGALTSISEQIHRFTTAIVRARTQDMTRFEDHERRLHRLETRRHRSK